MFVLSFWVLISGVQYLVIRSSSVFGMLCVAKRGPSSHHQAYVAVGWLFRISVGPVKPIRVLPMRSIPSLNQFNLSLESLKGAQCPSAIQNGLLGRTGVGTYLQIKGGFFGRPVHVTVGENTRENNRGRPCRSPPHSGPPWRAPPTCPTSPLSSPSRPV